MGNSNGFSNFLSGLAFENELLKKCDDKEVVARIAEVNS